MNAATVHIPVQATYRIVDGEAVMIAAEYADVPADTIARMLLHAFDIPFNSEGREPK